VRVGIREAAAMEQIIAGQFEMDPADRDAFLANRWELTARSRREPGCIVYVFAPDPFEPGLVQLFERWESVEALEAHRAGMVASPPPDHGVTLRRSELLQFAAEEVPRG
jgi:quinol monooxygenase YgiN